MHDEVTFAEFATWRSDSPVRPPDWRARLAGWLHANRRRKAVRTADVADALARRLLTSRYRWRRWPVPPKADRTAIRAAVAWRQTAPESVRAEAEARLLAGQSDAEVGAAVGLAPVVVGYFEQIFFHCRDRLANLSYIHDVFLFGDPAAPAVATALRRCGYCFGPTALAGLLAVVPRHGQRVRPLTAKMSGGREAELAEATARLWLASQLVPDLGDRFATYQSIQNRRDPERPFDSLQLDPFLLPLYANPWFKGVLGEAKPNSKEVETGVTPRSTTLTKKSLDSGLSPRGESVYGRGRENGGEQIVTRSAGATFSQP